MKGTYRIVIAVLLLIILLVLALLQTMAFWLLGFVGLWLPQGTLIALVGSPRLMWQRLEIPELHYLAGDCELATLYNAVLTHTSRQQVRSVTSIVRQRQ